MLNFNLYLSFGLLFLASSLYVTNILDSQVVVRYTFLSVFVFLWAIVFLKIRDKRTEISSKIRLFFLFFFGYFSASVISLFFSLDLANGIFEVSKIGLSGGVIFLVFISLRKGEQFVNGFTRVISLFGILITLIGFYELFGVYQDFGWSHHHLYRVSSLFGHKNLFAEYSLLLLPFTAHAMVFQKKFWRLIGFSSFMLISITLFYLMTRSVWVSGGITIFTGLLFILSIVDYKSIRFTKRAFLIVSTTILLLVVLFSANEQLRTIFKKQLVSTFNLEHGTAKDRLLLWEKSLRMIEENPLQGNGKGSWRIEVLKYGNTGQLSEDNMTFYQRPHNDFLWIAAEQGVFALVFYLLIFLLSILFCIKLFKTYRRSYDKAFILALLMTLISFLGISLFSFPSERIEHLVLISLVFGWILYLYDNDILHSNRKNRIPLMSVSVMILLLATCCIYIGANRYYGEKHLRKAFEHREKGEWTKMIRELDLSERQLYKIDPFSTPLNWHRGIAEFNRNNTKKGCEEFSKAHKLNPYHIHTLNNLGTCAGLKQNLNEAKHFYEEALKYAPNFEETLLNLSALFYKKQNIDSAYHYLSKIDEPIDIERYEKQVAVIGKAKIKSIADDVEEEEVVKLIQTINTVDWIRNIIDKSKNNRIKIEKQVFLDVLYILEKDSIFAKSDSEKIIEKYNL